jgi:hypothetical protein
MQHSKCNSHAYAYEWMKDVYAHAMQVQMCKLNTRVLHATHEFQAQSKFSCQINLIQNLGEFKVEN